ncbi:MAG: hypothetical protein E3J66_03270 [Dehalococcoidia bacterium]|nr:MAG: hypothetical protein E3J66_03270 [Dehalococcoidia bacterium]
MNSKGHYLAESQSVNPAVRTPYSLNSIPGAYERRVFVGGAYRYGALLKVIARAIEECGFIPILAFQFDIPRDTERHFCLRLLKKCKFTVFEASLDAGWMIELDWAHQYKKQALSLWDEMQGDEPRITSLVKSNETFRKNNKKYSTIRDLESHIYDFLRDK